MTTPLNGAQVCIVHCTALGARLPNVQRLQRLLGGAGAAVTVVSEPEPNVADLDSLRRDVNLDPASLGPGPLADMFRPAVGSLHMRQISNFGKHLVALRRIAAAGPGWHLVLEDDALCADDTVVDQLARTLGAAVEADVLFLGLPSRTVPASPTSPPVFESVDGVFNCLPCCDSYAVTAAAAARLVAALVPQRFATNVNLSWCLRSLELRAQLVAPNLFADGSKVGVYLSSIDVNNRLVWNPQFCRVEQLVNAVRTEKRALTPAERAELLELEASMRFKEHPDVAHLFAVFAASERRYAHAEAHFKHAMDLYDREMSLMGPKCQFLRDYMALYRHVQGGPAEQAGATAVASAVTAV